MITYKTKITSMSTVVEPTPNYIVKVLFTVIGTTDAIPPLESSVDSFVNFDVDPLQIDYKPYKNLTEEEVLSWIDPTLIGSMQLCVQGQIDSILNPLVAPKETPLPWEDK